MSHEDDKTLQVVRFTVGTQEFGIDVMSVVEIIVPREVSSVPGQPDFVAGLIELRNEYLPVVDMRPRFGVEPAGFATSKFLIVNCESRTIAMIVDRVGEVETLAAEDLQAPPVDSDVGGANSLAAICQRRDGMVMILDAAHLLSAEELLSLPA